MTSAVRYEIGDPGTAAARVGDGLPSPFPEWPDVHTQELAALGLDVRAASVRGLAHRAYGEPRQDACAVTETAGGTVVAVVSDGVGSLPLSHEAAGLVSSELPALLTSAPDWPQVLAALSALLRAQDTPASVMATTVVAAHVTRTADASWRTELCWVGDSAALLLRDGVWTPITGEVDDDDLHTGRTAALPADRIEPGTASVELRPGDALFLMSDGVALPLGSGHGEVGTALALWWTSPPTQADFADQVAFARRSFDDDRTVVGLWCPASVPDE